MSFKKIFILDRTESGGGGGDGSADKAEGDEFRALASWASALLVRVRVASTAPLPQPPAPPREDELDDWGVFTRAVRTGDTNLLVTLDIFLVIGVAKLLSPPLLMICGCLIWASAVLICGDGVGCVGLCRRIRYCYLLRSNTTQLHVAS